MTSPKLVSLSHAHRDGKPYQRHADTERQITDMLNRPKDEWPELFPELTDETLVYLLRHELRELPHFLGTCYDILSRRTLATIPRYCKGFDPTTADRVAEDVQNQVMLNVFEGKTRAQQFMECNFHHFVKHSTINAARRQKDVLSMDHNDLDEDALQEESKSKSVDAERTELDRDAVRKALAAITNPKHREAVVLRYIEGWPVHDADPSRPTLCTHFGRSSRAIRYWMETAEAQMRAVLGDAL